MLNEEYAGLNGFVWWIGVVEDRNDPLKLGRCRVRIFGWHPNSLSDCPTEALPWAQGLMPLNNSNTYTPKESDMVVGFFMDGTNGQNPVMMGVLPGIPLEASRKTGFNDLRDQSKLNVSPVKPWEQKINYPRKLDEPTTSRLARNEDPEQIQRLKASVNSQIERNPSYNAMYPYNNAVETESGHSFEMDDTPESERISLVHRTGTNMEMRPDGSNQQKIIGNSTRIIEKDELVHIKGNKLVLLMVI